MRILIVEDEPGIAQFLARGLTAEGYQVFGAKDGPSGLEEATSAEDLDLVLLDLTLPGLDGMEVLRELRQRKPSLPVILLTARDDLASKVTGFDQGANDYICKPFAFEELLARIRAQLRPRESPRADQISARNITLDLKSKTVRRGEQQIDLSAKEVALLEYFLRHPRQVLSRAQILNHVWGYDFDPESNIVDVYVRYLRRKLDDAELPSLIQTVRGMGYRLDP